MSRPQSLALRPPLRPDNGTGSLREPGRSTASCIRTRVVALHGTRTAGKSEKPPDVENSLWRKSPRGAASRNDASPLPDREMRFPFGLRRPPTLACSGFGCACRRGEWPRSSSLRALRYRLWPLRFGNDGARLMLTATRLATARRARLSRSTSLRARNASLGPSRLCSSALHSSSATATPPAFGERARKHRPALHAPLAYARSLSASGISGLRAHVATPADAVIRFAPSMCFANQREIATQESDGGRTAAQQQKSRAI